MYKLTFWSSLHINIYIYVECVERFGFSDIGKHLCSILIVAIFYPVKVLDLL